MKCSCQWTVLQRRTIFLKYSLLCISHYKNNIHVWNTDKVLALWEAIMHTNENLKTKQKTQTTTTNNNKRKQNKPEGLCVECYYEGHLQPMGWKAAGTDPAQYHWLPHYHYPSISLFKQPGKVSWESEAVWFISKKRVSVTTCDIIGSCQARSLLSTHWVPGPFWQLSAWGATPILRPVGRHSRRWPRLLSTPKERG